MTDLQDQQDTDNEICADMHITPIILRVLRARLSGSEDLLKKVANSISAILCDEQGKQDDTHDNQTSLLLARIKELQEQNARGVASVETLTSLKGIHGLYHIAVTENVNLRKHLKRLTAIEQIARDHDWK